MKESSKVMCETQASQLNDWLMRNTLTSEGFIGPQTVFRQQLRRSSRLASILAVNTAVCREKPLFRTKPRRAFQFLRLSRRAGAACMQVMRLYARQAKKTFGRSYLSQAIDIARIWWFADLPPLEYYKALMAKHGGSDGIYNYIDGHALFRVIVRVQLDVYGELPVAYNDKGIFAAWLRANDLPAPKGLAVRTKDDVPDEHALDELGDNIIIKPCAAGYGEDVEAYTKTGNDEWTGAKTTLSTRDLLAHIHKRAVTRRSGVMVQERVRNLKELEELCGPALSTCRFVTMRNEDGQPEVVEHYWRMGWPESVVDNYSAGGFLWMADFENGALLFGLHASTAINQRAMVQHPITGDNMVGRRHPQFEALRSLALKAHNRLGNVFFAGWDIASTPKGPVLIEVNIPCQTPPSAQMVSDGLGSARYGALMAFHADKWLAARQRR
ncbi:MAG: sugar-transfer associated ATP-grasp domain-containing protein [Pseudomonadota bacterium]